MATAALNIPGRGAVTLNQLHAELGRRDPLHLAWWLTDGRYKKARHLQAISDRIMSAIEKGGGRLIICAPPGHGKSEFLSRTVSSWHVYRYPEKLVGLCAYGDEFAESWGRKVRDFVMEHEPQLHVDIVGGDKAQVGNWRTSQGGGMICAGIMGGIMGKRLGLLIIDDPIKNSAEAYSPTYQMRLKDIYQSTLSSRLEPGATVIVTMQRWPGYDFVQWLIDGKDEGREHWDVVLLPAIAEDDDPIGRSPGEALWPERYDVAALEAKRLSLEDPSFWSAQWQQNPMKEASKGLAYHAFNSAESPVGNIKHFEYDPNMRLCLACDFNVDPMAWLICQIERPQPPGYVHPWQGRGPEMPKWKFIRILDEIYLQNTTTQEATYEFIRRTEKWASRHNKLEVAIYGDASGHSRKTTAPADYRVMDEIFKQDGRYVTANFASKSDPAVRDRVTTVNNAFLNAAGERHLLIDPKCKELRKDLGFMRFKRDLAGNPTNDLDKTNPQRSHISDALGYLVWREMAMKQQAGERREYLI